MVSEHGATALAMQEAEAQFGGEKSCRHRKELHATRRLHAPPIARAVCIRMTADCSTSGNNPFDKF